MSDNQIPNDCEAPSLLTTPKASSSLTTRKASSSLTNAPNHAKRRRAERQRMNRRALGFEPGPCRWDIFGCQQTISGDPEIAQVHETLCPYAGDEQVRIDFEKFKIHEERNNISSEDGYWDIIRDVANRFTYPSSVNNTDNIPGTSGPVMYPLIFETSLCWTSAGMPSRLELFRHVLDKPSLKAQTTVVVPKDANPFDILAQLNFAEHRPQDVQYVLNANPTDLTTKYPLKIPHWLEKRYSDPQGEVTVNATPTFTSSELHCDRGLSTVCVMMYDCVKLWILWPPTEHNVKTFYPAYEESLRRGTQCLRTIVASLQGGQAVIVDSTKAIYIPPGWIHWVYTLSGGYLIGKSFSGREDLELFIECLERELEVASNIPSQEDTIRFMVKVIASSLLSTDGAVVRWAACIFLRLVAAIEKSVLNRGLVWTSGLERELVKAIKDCGHQNPIALEGDCPCGKKNSGGKYFFDHFVRHAKVP